MIKLKVKIEDCDECSYEVFQLPCALGGIIDVSHNIEIVECSPSIRLGDCSDIVELNNILDEIDCSSPEMSVELLNVLMRENNISSINNEDFIRKICDRDFMLEEVTDSPKKLRDKESRCAAFLLQRLKIPFVKKITKAQFDDLMKKPYPWVTIWMCYYRMGFRTFEFDDKLYVLNWRDAK